MQPLQPLALMVLLMIMVGQPCCMAQEVISSTAQGEHLTDRMTDPLTTSSLNVYLIAQSTGNSGHGLAIGLVFNSFT
jgi:hypothetical protein